MKTMKALFGAILVILALSRVGAQAPFKEDLSSRDAYWKMELQTDGRLQPDATANAQEWVLAHMAFNKEAWGAFAGGPLDWLGPDGGRVRAIVVMADDPNTIFVGGVSGGIRKSTDGGQVWVANTDLALSTAINCMIAVDSQTLYAGTGEGYGNGDAMSGNGIFVTRNRGATWRQVPSTGNGVSGNKFQFVNRLAYKNGVLLAATRNYSGNLSYGQLHRSTDGGTTWTHQTFPNPMVSVVFGQGIVLATSYNGNLYSSIDNGVTWVENTDHSIGHLPVPVALQRLEVAFAPDNPAIVYGSVAGANGGLFKSTNGGLSFLLVGQPVDKTAIDGGGVPNVSWYTNTLLVFDQNTLIMAGAYAWLTRDGGITGREFSSNQTHEDHQIYGLVPGTTIVYDGNDGGIFRTTDALVQCPPGVSCVQYESLNHGGLCLAQAYGMDVEQATGRIAVGTQDNGGQVYESGSWRMIFGGDGGQTAIEQATGWVYGEYVGAQVNAGDGYSYSTQIWQSIPPWHCAPSICANFTAPLVLDMNGLLVGGSNLWLTRNPRSAVPLWRERKASSDNYINAISVTPARPGLVWVGHNDGLIEYSVSGTGGSETPSWTVVDPNHQWLPFGDRACNRIILAGTEVYVVYGGFYPSILSPKGNVWHREPDGSWTDISHNLPPAPIYDLLVSPTDPNWLGLATEVGVFASSNKGLTWSPLISGPPPTVPGLNFGGVVNTRIMQMKWRQQDGETQLVLATHGRGVAVVHPATHEAPLAASPTPSPTCDAHWGKGEPPCFGFQVSKTGPATIQTGQQLTYTISAFNSDPFALDGVMTDQLAAGVTFVSAVPSQGTCTGTSNISCNMGSVPSGATVTVVLTVIPTVTGLLRNEASFGGLGNSGVCYTTVISAPTPTPTPTATATATIPPTPAPTPTATATATATPALSDGLANLSTRGKVMEGEPFIGGFIITGSRKTIVVRALGPTLAQFGIPDFLVNPTLELHDVTHSIAQNDNWQDDQNANLVRLCGLAPESPVEAALYRVLAPGSYTAVVGGGSGTTIVEVYCLP